MNVEVNLLSVLLAAVASMIVGFIYYNPAVLGKPWMKEMGYTEAGLKKEQQKMGKYYALSFILAMVSAFVLTHMIAYSINFYNFSPVTTGLTTAFWMWLGFVMPVQATNQIFGKENWKLFSLNTGYQLASLLAMGLVLGYMN